MALSANPPTPPVTDCFALLDEPRRPWLDEAALKEKFLARSAQVHPDRVHGAPAGEQEAAGRRYAELNGAYQCLRDPKLRLRQLLELETGTKPAEMGPVPAGLMDVFAEIGRACRAADAVIAERGKASSPVVKATIFQRGLDQIEALKALQQRVTAQQVELFDELKAMNLDWDAARAAGRLPLVRLEEIYRLLGYFSKWSEQLRERIVQLSL